MLSNSNTFHESTGNRTHIKVLSRQSQRSPLLAPLSRHGPSPPPSPLEDPVHPTPHLRHHARLGVKDVLLDKLFRQQIKWPSICSPLSSLSKGGRFGRRVNVHALPDTWLVGNLLLRRERARNNKGRGGERCGGREVQECSLSLQEQYTDCVSREAQLACSPLS